MANRPDANVLIFDMDGTLIDSNPTHKVAYGEFLKRHDIEMTDDDFMKYISGRMNPDIMKHFFGDDIGSERIQALTQEKESLFHELYAPVIKPINGLVPFLEAAHDAGFLMVLATSAPMMNVDFVFDHIPIRKFFAKIVSEQDVQVGKPDPTVFRLAAERVQASPDQCLVFEDSQPGVEAAKAAGMNVVVLTTTHSPNELGEAELAIDDYTQVTVDQLRELIKQPAQAD
ncbi:HAD family hydrolase [Spirosoma radiotolerans]|uniref:Haloacid dehalogenase n=1 Tax=Spirosoma radiotolerans TaxID=1379870 RepID=A0A0E3ZYT6_9BACT|nr:HAD family phosphatase [Spirosoma radiotolerans]AKD57644.1 haloacid dehalogenase [Spirosoma radiotolerans]